LATQANYSPLAACLCDVCCCHFGAAYNRMKIREAVGIPGDYCYDCVVYQQGCLCCYGVQECMQVKNMQGRMATNRNPLVTNDSSTVDVIPMNISYQVL